MPCLMMDERSYPCQKTGLASILDSDDEDPELAHSIGLVLGEGHPACSVVVMGSVCQLQEKPQETSLLFREDGLLLICL